MSNCSFSQFRDKEVINTANGCRLGFVCDVEIDLCEGRIISLCVPGKCGILGVLKASPITIPWGCIERIGEDIILVNATGLIPCREKKERGKKEKC